MANVKIGDLTELATVRGDDLMVVVDTLNDQTKKALVSKVVAAAIQDGEITTDKIADGAVTAAKLEDTAVNAGTYANATITVDQQGRLIYAATGSGGGVGVLTEVNGGVWDSGVPSSRVRIRMARGTFAQLDALKNDFTEGEICFATDQNTLYVKKGGDLISTGGSGGDGSVTSVGITNTNDTDFTITNSPITDEGDINIALKATGVVAKQYTNPTITVGADGRISLASDGQAPTVEEVDGGDFSSGTPSDRVKIKLARASYIQLVAEKDNLDQFEVCYATDTDTLYVKEGEDLVVVGGSGTVTSVGLTGDNGITITGGPITDSGTIDVKIANTAVSPGSYDRANITVDAQGRITHAETGSAEGTGTVTSIGITAGDGIVVNPLTPVTTSGNITVGLSDLHDGSPRGPIDNATVTIDKNGRVTALVAGTAPVITEVDGGQFTSATPDPRVKILTARGDFTDLDTNKNDIVKGELAFAEDTNTLYFKDATSLVPITSEVPSDVARLNVAQTFIAGQRGQVTQLTSASVITVNFNSSNNFTITLDDNAGYFANPTNAVPGQSGSIFIEQDVTGNRTVSWSAYWKFGAAGVPSLSTGANACDRVDYIVKDATSIHAVFTAAY